MRTGLAFLCGVASAIAALAEPGSDGTGIDYRHGFSMFGELKYPPDYAHFDYVNPGAQGRDARSPSRRSTGCCFGASTRFP